MREWLLRCAALILGRLPRTYRLPRCPQHEAISQWAAPRWLPMPTGQARPTLGPRLQGAAGHATHAGRGGADERRCAVLNTCMLACMGRHPTLCAEGCGPCRRFGADPAAGMPCLPPHLPGELKAFLRSRSVSTAGMLEKKEMLEAALALL